MNILIFLPHGPHHCIVWKLKESSYHYILLCTFKLLFCFITGFKMFLLKLWGISRQLNVHFVLKTVVKALESTQNHMIDKNNIRTSSYHTNVPSSLLVLVSQSHFFYYFFYFFFRDTQRIRLKDARDASEFSLEMEIRMNNFRQFILIRIPFSSYFTCIYLFGGIL